MHIIKPNTLGLLVRTIPRESGFGLVASAYACFSLKDAKQSALLSEADMWGLLRQALRENDIFDLGYPKPNAEFLLYGRCFPPADSTGMNVSVLVGDLQKTLQVMGERHWQGDYCSAPKKLEPLRLDWSQAYGGPDFPFNPLGKGHTREKKADGVAAPRILRPNDLLTRPEQEHDPVGFTALPPCWPQRTQLLGAFDDRWKFEDWPYLPGDSQAEYFCTAQPDQRFKGFLAGNEPIAIQGAHPEQQGINARLPGVRARLFAMTRTRDREQFAELPSVADTLWLLPEQEAGILCCRGVLLGVDEDAADVAHFVADWELLDTEPLPAAHYRQILLSSISSAPEPGREQEKEPEPPEEAISPPTAESGGMALPETLSPELGAVAQQVREFEASVTNYLARFGLTREDTDTLIQSVQPEIKNPFAGQSIEETAAAMQQEVRGFLTERGLSVEALERFLEENQVKPPSPAEVQGFFDQALAQPAVAPQTRAALLEAQKAHAELAAVVQSLSQSQVERNVETESIAGEAVPAPDEPRMRKDESHAAKDFSGADFKGRSLSWVNFQNAILDGADFTDAVLQGADFTGAILTNAVFTNAHLDGVQLVRVKANGADFSMADLFGANLSGSDFSEANFTKVSFDSAILDRSDFSNALLCHIRAVDIRAEKVSFAKADLTGAYFVGANLKQAGFSHAILHNADFSEANADKAEFYGAYGKHTVFRNASLVNSRADHRTRFPHATFRNADLRKARWSGANLKGANLWNVTMDHCDFSNSVLDETVLVRVTARWANVSKASIEGANMRRINLFRGSLRKARVVNARIQLANLFGVDMYGLHIVNSVAEESNLQRTLRERTSENA